MARLSSVTQAPGLPRTCIDEVERVAVEIRARHRDRIERLLRRVQATELPELLVIQRLYAERDAINAGGAIAPEAARFHAAWISFQRDFDIGCNGPVLADAVENRRDRRWLHQGWRAAAKENARHRSVWYACGCQCNFGFECAHEARLVDATMTNVAVEIAVRTFRQAKRPMHIDGEGGHAWDCHVNHTRPRRMGPPAPICI